MPFSHITCIVCGNRIEPEEGEGNLSDGFTCYECSNKSLIINDPTEKQLYNAYGNDLIDKICKSLAIYEQGDGKIQMQMALKIIRSFRE